MRVALSLFSSDCNAPKWKRKVLIISRLHELGLDQERINILLAFVDRLKPMNSLELRKFEEYTVKHFKGEAPMILTSIEERALKKGMQRGKRKGMQKGMQIGRNEGMQKGMQIGRNEGMQIGRNEGMQIGRNEGMQIGRNEGMQKGMQKAVFTIAKNMKKLGLEISIIKSSTGLSDSEIEKL